MKREPRVDFLMVGHDVGRYQGSYILIHCMVWDNGPSEIDRDSLDMGVWSPEGDRIEQ
jgi:hypothetical protein